MSTCDKTRHKVKKIERIVLNALRRQLEIFKQLAKKLEEEQKNKQTDLPAIQKEMEKQLETLPEKQEKEFLLASIQGANRKIYEQSLADPAMSGMGTTVVQAVVRGGVAHVAHMGDSRAYLFHHDQLQQITRDHSYVQEMVDSGKLSAEEAERHPKKNLITRAMGVSAAALAEYTACPVKAGDILLICTDGLSNTLPLQSMQEILRKTQFFDMADRLVEQALQEGAQDNITALLIGIEPTEA